VQPGVFVFFVIFVYGYNMTIGELLQQVRSASGSGEDDLLGTELVLAFVLGKNREYLLTNDREVLSDNQLRRFYDFYDRMADGEPVAYLLGKKEFFGLEFAVDKRVLIPRPETEHLVERVLGYLKPNFNGGIRSAVPGSSAGSTEAVSILDIGTGSGCIAVALAKNLPAARVTGTDISQDALDVAAVNAEKYGVAGRVRFIKSDLLEQVGDRFEIVVANLPYIGVKRFSFVSKSACDYEPHVALFGGDDGLGLYGKFLEQLSRKSWRPKLLAGEFGFLQRDELEALFVKYFPGVKISFEQDYAHIDRIFVVEFPAIADKGAIS
jgi:release factor glutamine methyltransferase